MLSEFFYALIPLARPPQQGWENERNEIETEILMIAII